jgi:SAM-dependent methyltransferase
VNLLELIAKNDPNVRIQVWDEAARNWTAHPDPRSLVAKITRRRIRFAGLLPRVEHAHIRGIPMQSGMRVVVKRASEYWPNYAQGKGVFKVAANGAAKGTVIVGWLNSGDDNVQAPTEIISGPKVVEVPVKPSPGKDLDLVILVPVQKGVRIFLGIHRLLDRAMLYAHCKGDGIEIGPGPKPQILPSADTRVKYVEQATPDRWHQLYGKDTKVPVDPELWKLYVVGNADKVPAEPGSLDFIFSSHVVEHLADPLGHLAYWCSLLRPGGVVAAVIPDKGGCKDYVFQLSTMEELDTEHQRNAMVPTLAHYERWAKFRAPKSNPADILASGRSIHVHFYTPESMADILERTHRKLGFRRFSVTSEPNHKDFFVLLEK